MPSAAAVRVGPRGQRGHRPAVPEAVYAAPQWQLEIVLAALANPSELAADASGSGVGVDRRCRGYSALVEVAQWSRLRGALVD